MTLRRMKKRLISLIAAAFAAIAAMLWLNEYWDLPHRLFGAPPTPANPCESLFESALVVSLGVWVVYLTLRLFDHIKYLEGFWHLCGGCRRVFVGGRWEEVDHFLATHSEARLDRSLCPECEDAYRCERNLRRSRRRGAPEA